MGRRLPDEGVKEARNERWMSMPKGTNQKLKLYYLARIMIEKTDDTHALDMKGIRRELENYEVTADRKSLYDDMKALESLGILVEGEKRGRNYYYHVSEKPFEIAELKLLVDAIQSSKFITEKKSRQLIEKLTDNVSTYEKAQLNRQVVVSGRIKTMNESIYYNVDAIYNAINENRAISFEYLKWNMEKQLVPRKSLPYKVSPWALMWNDENYYLIGFDAAEGRMKHYRVDKMRRINMTKDAREGRDIFKTIDLASYTKENFGMFGGTEVSVHLRFKNEIVGVFIDRFGKDIMIIPSEEEGWSDTHVDVALSRQFFGWVFALGGDIRIVHPQSVAEQFRAEAEKIVEGYRGRS